MKWSQETPTMDRRWFMVIVTVITLLGVQQLLNTLADSLREEVNEQGVRVLSVYPGRTATPRQAGIFEAEGREYTPERLLQPEDLAGMVAGCLALPRTAEVTDLFIRPAHK